MKLQKKYVKKMLNYCKSKWGMSKYQDDFPSLIIYTKMLKEGEKDWDVLGVFDEITNTIHIYMNHHETYEDIADTIVHEYTHYLQNVEKMYKKYLTYYTFNYHNHPYEIVAVKRGKNFKNECLQFAMS